MTAVFPKKKATAGPGPRPGKKMSRAKPGRGMPKAQKESLQELEDLRARLEEAEETIRTIRKGKVDALMVSTSPGEHPHPLKGAEQSYRIFLESMNEGALTVTSEGTLYYSNRRFAELVQEPVEKVINRNLFEFIAQQDRRVAGWLIDRGSLEGSEGKIRLMTKEGGLVPVLFSVSPLQLEDRQVACAVVTDLRREEETRHILASEELSRFVIEQAKEPIVVCDEKGRMIRVNQAAEKLCSHSLLYRPFDKGFHVLPKDPSGTNPALRISEVLEGRSVEGLEVNLRTPEGRLIPFLLNAGPLVDHQKQIKGCVITLTDISEINRLAAELRQQAKELKSANLELEAFASTAAHDLKTPLVVMSLLSERLISGYKDRLDSSGQKYLGQLQSSSQQMMKLIEDLLDFSRASKIEMKMERVNLSALARASLEEHRKLDLQRQVEEVIQEELYGWGDERLLRILLGNLLGNAWKFTSRREVARIEFGAVSEGGRPIFFVSDNGCGFDIAYAEQVFLPFRRLQGSDEFSGTGIGLAIARKIVERHKSAIWVESQPDQGTTFFFTLPSSPV